MQQGEGFGSRADMFLLALSDALILRDALNENNVADVFTIAAERISNENIDVEARSFFAFTFLNVNVFLSSPQVPRQFFEALQANCGEDIDVISVALRAMWFGGKDDLPFDWFTGVSSRKTDMKNAMMGWIRRLGDTFSQHPNLPAEKGLAHAILRFTEKYGERLGFTEGDYGDVIRAAHIISRGDEDVQ